MQAGPSSASALIGRVLRASIAEYTFGCRSLDGSAPAFGSFVRARPRGRTEASPAALIGVVADIRIEEDPLVRQLVSAEVREEYLNDQRQRRAVPIEIHVIQVGFLDPQGTALHQLPPQPPLTLEEIEPCGPEDLRRFLRQPSRGWQLGFLRLLLDSQVSDETIAAVIRQASAALPEVDRGDFLIQVGREAARLLSHDLRRLDSLLRILG